MNAFDMARTVEARALARLLPFVDEQSNGHYVLTDKGRLAPLLQQVVGDVMFNDRKSRVWALELKAEQRHTGNLFLETWSNRNLDDPASHAMRGSNSGWLWKLQADLLFYYFLDADKLYVADVFALKRWAFGHDGAKGRLYDFPEHRQARYEQANDTHGRLVPVSVLRAEMEPPLRQYTVTQFELFPQRAA